MNPNYISVTEFQTYNPELDLSGYTATTISGMISRASRSVDNYLQVSTIGVEDIVAEETEASVSSNGNLIIYTRKFPIVSVSSIKLKLGTVSLQLNLTDGNGNARYEIPSRKKSIMYPYQEIAMTGVFSVRNFYQIRDREIYTVINYRAGFETIPDDIKDAVNLWTKDIFIRQSNPTNVKSATQGAISITYKDNNDETGDSVLLKQAKQILNSYKRVF